jgi:hypothetical protein
MNNLKRFGMLAIIGMSLLLLVSPGALKPALALGTTVSLGFNSLPSAQAGWAYLNDPLPHLATPETTYFSIVGSALHIDTRGRNGDGTYGYEYPITPDPNQPFTLTFVARSTGYQRWSPAGFMVYVQFPTFFYSVELATGPNTIVAGAGPKTFSTSIDVSQYHEYRLQAIPGGQFELFVDNVSLGFGDPDLQTGPTRLFVGDGTRGGDTVGDLTSFSFMQTPAVIGTDPGLNGCYVYAPNAVNEGDTFQTTVKCHAITSDVFGFQFGTTFTPSLVTRNGVPNVPAAMPLGTAYTPGDFAPTNALVGMNSLSALYAVSHTGTDTTTGDFTLGSFDATAPLGITTNSSATVDLRDLKLADRSGADIATSLPQSQAVITINNLFVAQREAGTLRVASDGTMTNIRTIHLNLDDGSPLDVATAPGSYHDFSVTAYQYPVDKQSADIAISMISHLACTKNVPLSDGLNPASVLGTIYTLKAGDVNGDGTINIDDAVLVGGYFGTSRTDGADINGDGTINIYDLVHIGRNYTAVAGTCS